MGAAEAEAAEEEEEAAAAARADRRNRVARGVPSAASSAGTSTCFSSISRTRTRPRTPSTRTISTLNSPKWWVRLTPRTPLFLPCYIIDHARILPRASPPLSPFPSIRLLLFSSYKIFLIMESENRRDLIYDFNYDALCTGTCYYRWM